MEALSEREIAELVDACGKRVCTTEQHHGCPYGDDGCIDCADRLQADYDKSIKRLLAVNDENRSLQRKLDEALKCIPHTSEDARTVPLPAEAESSTLAPAFFLPKSNRMIRF